MVSSKRVEERNLSSFFMHKGSRTGKDMEFDYKSKKWRRKRAAILKRDKYFCQECKKYGRKRDAVTVHHIKHADTNPELAYVDSNLVSLCQGCHNKMHPEKGGRKY